MELFDIDFAGRCVIGKIEEGRWRQDKRKCPLLCRAVKGYRSCAELREWSEGAHVHLGASRRHGSRGSPMNGRCGTVRRRLIAGLFGLFSESRQDGCPHKSGFPVVRGWGAERLPFCFSPRARMSRVCRGRSHLKKRMWRDAELQHRLGFTAHISDDPPTAVFFPQIVHFFVPAIDGCPKLCILGRSPDHSRAGYFGG